MDRQTLRALIIQYREKGKSFSEIANILKEEYGIVKDRQTIHGIYKRAMAKSNEEKDKLNLAADIVNLHVLGYNRAEITNMAKMLGHDVSYYIVRNILNKNEAYANEVKRHCVYKIVSMLTEGKAYDEIRESISYKGIPPKDKALRNLLTEAHVLCIKDVCVRELVKVYRDTEDSDLISQIIKNLDLGSITVAEVKSRA